MSAPPPPPTSGPPPGALSPGKGGFVGMTPSGTLSPSGSRSMGAKPNATNTTASGGSSHLKPSLMRPSHSGSSLTSPTGGGPSVVEKSPLEAAAKQETQKYEKDELLDKFVKLQLLYNDPQRQRVRFKMEEAKRRGERNDAPMCWLCVQKAGYVSLHGRYILCYFCVRDVLLTVQLPKLRGFFHHSDCTNVKAVEEYVREYPKMIAASGKQQSSQFLATPGSPTPNTETSEWHCYKCTLANSHFDSVCQVCSTPRQEVICRQCNRDILTVKFCKMSQKNHLSWSCPGCGTICLEETIVCSGCYTPRPWYCDGCGHKNQHPDTQCVGCNNAGDRLSSVGSFANRQDMKHIGINIDEAHKEKERIDEIELHKARLKERIYDMGQRPSDISDDGNCLFRALAEQLLQDEALFPLFREMTCEYMEINKQDYIPFMGQEGVDEYISELRKDKTWGDEFTLQAASKLFFTTVHVLTSEKVRWHLKYKPFSLPTSEYSDSAWAKYVASIPKAQQQTEPVQISEESEVLVTNSRQIFLAYVSPVHYYSFHAPVKHQDITMADLEKVLATDLNSLRSPTASSPTTSLGQKQHSGPLGDPKNDAGQRLSTSGNLVGGQFSQVKPKKIRDLRHPLVVLVRLGNTSSNISIERQGATLEISKEAARFYLHPIGDNNNFVLQCVRSGLFVSPLDHRKEVTRGGSPRPLGLVRLGNSANFHNMIMFCDPATERVTFPNSNPVQLHVHYDGQSRIYASERPQTAVQGPSPLVMLAPFGDGRERFCLHCASWFDVDDVASPLPRGQATPAGTPQRGATGVVPGLSGKPAICTSHQSYCETAQEAIKEILR